MFSACTWHFSSREFFEYPTLMVGVEWIAAAAGLRWGYYSNGSSLVLKWFNRMLNMPNVIWHSAQINSHHFSPDQQPPLSLSLSVSVPLPSRELRPQTMRGTQTFYTHPRWKRYIPRNCCCCCCCWRWLIRGEAQKIFNSSGASAFISEASTRIHIINGAGEARSCSLIFMRLLRVCYMAFCCCRAIKCECDCECEM